MKHLFTLRILFLCLFASLDMRMSAAVIDYQDGDSTYYRLNTETQTAELAKYSGSATEVIIPESVTYNDVTYSVTALGDYCFNICYGLTSIEIPSSVTSLGDVCFGDCHALTSIEIPSSVTSLGRSCFRNCPSITSITVDEDNPMFDSRDNCNAIIETQSNTMLYGCKNTIIPSSVTSLGHSCFNGCSSLTFIDIPSSVTTLGRECFYDCGSLKSIDIPSSVTSLGDQCFYGCSSFTSINIPSSVTSLGDDCFKYCVALTSINIPSSVTTLGSYCFSFCSSLTSINIPSSVTSLGHGCFWNCQSLKFVYIPSSVTSLGYYSFHGCDVLTTVTCEMPTAIKGSFFNWHTIKQATLYVPEASLESYKTTSPWSDFGAILPISGTGIESIPVSEPTIEAIYNIAGKRMNNMSRGLNILRMSDGTTKKVLK